MGTSQKSTTTGIQIQGNLLTQDISKEILEAKIKGQAALEFGLSKNQKLEDEIAIAWGAIKANWMAFKRQVERLKTNEVGTKLTTEMLAIPLLRTIGYAPIPNPIHENIDGVIYSISHRATPPEIKESTIQYAPLHIIGYGLGLEDRVQRVILVCQLMVYYKNISIKQNIYGVLLRMGYNGVCYVIVLC